MRWLPRRPLIQSSALLLLGLGACGDSATTEPTVPEPELCASAADCQQSQGTPSACSGWSCQADGSCLEVALADGAACASDGDVCTIDACAGGVCTHTPDTSVCECEGLQCPPSGDYGDSLEMVFDGTTPIETVGSAIIDGHVFTCGGFGLDVFRVTESDSLLPSDAALSRCQNLTAGPVISGRRIVYVAHHGDSYVKGPTLNRLVFEPSRSDVITTTLEADDIVSFEGLDYDEATGILWVAVHGEGVWRYQTAALDGDLTLIDKLAGFENAYRLRVVGELVYVADGDAGLKILDRDSGAVVGSFPTRGFASDVVVTNNMAFIATASIGVTVVDVSAPGSPALVREIETGGQALQVRTLKAGDLVVAANWRDVVVIDARSPEAVKLLAVDKGTPVSNVARLLSVATDGDGLIASSDWLGTSLLRWREGLVGPEIDVSVLEMTFSGVDVGDEATQTLSLTNRGFRTLDVTEIRVDTDDAIWSVTPSTASLAPGESVPVDVQFQPSAVVQGGLATLTLVSNDPDEPVASIDLSGNFGGSRLGPGDALTDSFDFLDTESPPGAQSLENLRGDVIVLAYFATF